MKVHTSKHRTIIADDKAYCLQCDLGDKKPYIVETWSNDPTEGQTRHFVCSECQQDIDEGVCKNHGLISI